MNDVDISRRALAALFILLGSTFIAYILVANSGDPLGQAKAIPNPELADGFGRADHQ